MENRIWTDRELEARAQEVRRDFAIFREDPGLVYLDNAATMQRPDCVLETEKKTYELSNANPFRGIYALSVAATDAYEDSRKKAAEFIHAPAPETIVFTRNASESLNLVAFTYGMSSLHPGDEIVVSVEEHHSNFLPWKMVAETTGATLVKLECAKTGEITPDLLKKVLTDKTKLVALTQSSNVFSKVNDVAALAKLVHEAGAVIVVDGAQSVPHMPVNVTELDVDFLAFSGHKMGAAMGIGVLYGRPELLEKMPPFMRGGEMIETVHWDRVTYAEVPHKFEAGTVNVGGAVSLAAAIDYYEKIGFDFIEQNEARLTRLLMKGLSSLPGVTVIGSQSAEDHHGIVAFAIEGVHPHDIATILDKSHICIRAGHHCAQPLMDYLGVRSISRASVAIYNTAKDVAKFISCVGQIREEMGYVR